MILQEFIRLEAAVGYLLPGVKYDREELRRSITNYYLLPWEVN
jgi:hypothetical protein